MKNITIILIGLIFINTNPLRSQPKPDNQWTYIQVDSTRQNISSLSKTWLRAFGLAFRGVNGDGCKDIASGRHLHINPGGDMTGKWQRHSLITTWSMNNLDAGDIDLTTNEHKGAEHPTCLFENDGTGNFIKHEIDRGKEMHLGARLCDLDGDGDLDMVGTGWEQPPYMHVWRNDAVCKTGK